MFHGAKRPSGKAREGILSPKGLSAKLTPQVQEEGSKDQKETQSRSRAWLSYLAGPEAVHREGQGAGGRGAASVEERAIG